MGESTILLSASCMACSLELKSSKLLKIGLPILIWVGIGLSFDSLVLSTGFLNSGPGLQVWGANGTVKVPYEIYQEIAVSTGPLHDWLTDTAVSEAMLLDMTTDPNHLNQVLTGGYAPDLSDSEIEEIGQDPFLIAYALVNPTGTAIVTKEVSAPSKQRANRRVPDVCRTFGIRCINDFEFYRELDFKIT